MAIIRHLKTDNDPDWDQAQLDAQIALGNYPPGTLIADIVQPSDWNAAHSLSLEADENFVTAAEKTKLSNLSGTNTGDQTSIVGITGTKNQFDTACTDGNFLYVGDVTQYTDEMAQDAVGAMVSGNTETLISVTYDDAGNKLNFAVTATLSSYTNDAGFITSSTAAATYIPLSYLDTDVTLAANSDTKIATQKAVKAYADGLIAAANATIYKGATDCSANPNYPAADAGWLYRVSVGGKIGGSSGVVVQAGDMFICLTDGTASGNQATVGANWSVIQANIDGAVIGPSSATDSNFALFDGTTGKLIKNSAYNPASFQAALSGTGFVKISGTTISYDNSTYLTTASAASSYQPLDSDLTTIAGLTATTDNFIQSKGSAWASRTPTQVTADLIAFTGDSGSGGVKGLVPAPAAGDAAASKYLKADGTWATVVGGGGTPTDITVANEATDSTCFPAFFTAATGNLGPKTNTGLTFDSSNGTFGATRVFAGSSTAITTGTVSTQGSQTVGTGAEAKHVIGRFSNNSSASFLSFAKSRGATIGAYDIVQSGDNIANINFYGADGVDLDSLAAQIMVSVDGTPGSNDMPGRMTFLTTADGAATATERLRIDSKGVSKFSGKYYSAQITCTTSVDWNGGNVQYIQLANGGQSFTFSNPNGGDRLALVIKQPASGAAGTVTWPADVLWSGGTPPTLTATNNKVDIITFIYDSTNAKYYGGSSLNY